MSKFTVKQLPSDLLKEIKRETEDIHDLLEPTNLKKVETGEDGVIFITFEGHQNTVDQKNDRIIKREIKRRVNQTLQRKVFWTISNFEECGFFDKKMLLEKQLHSKERENEKLRRLLAQQDQMMKVLADELLHEMHRPGGGSEFQKAKTRFVGMMGLKK